MVGIIVCVSVRDGLRLLRDHHSRGMTIARFLSDSFDTKQLVFLLYLAYPKLT